MFYGTMWCLQEVNFSGNKIGDISVGDQLSACPKLTALHLSKNPITLSPNYRLVIASLIPELTMLDGVAIDSSATKKVIYF